MAGLSERVGDPDPIALMKVGGDSFWVHAMGHLEKPLATRVGTSPARRSKLPLRTVERIVLKIPFPGTQSSMSKSVQTRTW
jgi:hypothetical protein